VARRKLTDVSHPDPLLTDDFWLEFGDDPQPPMRLKILYVTFGEVARSGPGAFNVADVCDRLGITYPMVNHYFGGRDGLLAEGASMVYRKYIESLWKAVQAAPRNPEARLKAWTKEQISQTVAIGGWGPILNYPLAAREVTNEIRAKFQQPMNRLFELNLARLAMMANDIRRGIVTDVDFTEENYPRADMLNDPFLIRVLPTVAWSTFGLSVWLGGQHAPARNIKEISMMLDGLVENHLESVNYLIKNRTT
jgi:AcrR family transcriptional regulator